MKSFFDFIGLTEASELLKANAFRKILQEACSMMKTGKALELDNSHIQDIGFKKTEKRG